MPGFLARVMHPDWYHGHGKQPPFFEGWYFKLIDASEQHRYAVIPGIFLSREGEKHHAFVQVLDGQSGRSAYFTFPPDQFHAADNEFDVHIGDNHFRADGLKLRLGDADLALNGEVSFVNQARWPVTWRAPGIMGWFGWLTFMECYHGVVSLDHTIQGSLELGGQQLNFSGGRGYIEKDWGQSFPSSYIWMQSNHFEQAGVCLTASIASIPFKVLTFPGFIIGLWHNGQLYRFATYTGAQVEKLAVTDDHVDWVLRDRHYRLEILATRTQGGLLHAPSRAEMHRRVEETLKATVAVRLSELSSNRELFSGTGRNAGLEVFGKLTPLLK
ncbi:MAG: tocopherol cyclase family protein [Anaerolineae bacterium]